MKLLALLLPLLLLVACSAPVLPAPQLGSVDIESTPELPVSIDGLPMGMTPVTIPMIENYPNYLQVGEYKIVLLPPCTYSVIHITPDSIPSEYMEDQLVLEWKQP